MGGSEVKSNAGEEQFGFLYPKGSAQGFFSVRIQIVQHQVDMDSCPVGFHAVTPEKVGGSFQRTTGGDVNRAGTSERINRHKQDYECRDVCIRSRCAGLGRV